MQEVNLNIAYFKVTFLNMLKVDGTFHLSEVQFYVNEMISKSFIT